MKRAALLSLALLAGCAGERDSITTLHGKIDARMADQVSAALERGQRDFVIDSPGGYVVVAILLGSRIDHAGGSLTVVGPCQSACSLMLMAVKRRYIADGGYVELHASNKGGIAQTYRSLGVPPEVAQYADSLNLHRLTSTELAAAGIRGVR